MNAFASLITILQVLTALGMIGLILIQHGKGADMGVSFGSGSSGSLFGASGSANFLSRTTAVLATVFFVATLALAWLGTARTAPSGSVLESVTPAAVVEPPPAAIPSDIPEAVHEEPAAAAGGEDAAAATPATPDTPTATDTGMADPEATATETTGTEATGTEAAGDGGNDAAAPLLQEDATEDATKDAAADPPAQAAPEAGGAPEGPDSAPAPASPAAPEPTPAD